MKTVRITALNKRLELQEVARPVPGTGQVLVEVKAAGICHSDAHYRAGTGNIGALPLTPGHEVAGVVSAVGPGVDVKRVGQRVCLHYLITCGDCDYCRRGIGQFCPEVAMIGKDVDGGYAEYIVVPEQNAVPLPEEIPFSHGAVLMCSFATALHALRKARLAEGESVAVCGTGGLGMAAIGLARALGASTVFGIDVNDAKLRAAEKLGAIVVDASRENPIETVLDRTAGHGVDVALELVGKPATAQLAVRILAVQGRAAMVGLANTSTDINMYSDLIGREREIIGVSDHLPEELEELIGLVKNGQLDIAAAVSRSVPLEEDAINAVFDELDAYSGHSIRTVISLE